VAESRVLPLTRSAIDVGSLLAGLAGPGDGAAASFTGVVRDNHDGRRVAHLEYEAHEEMAAAQMGRLAADATGRWGLGTVRLQHRLGRLELGEVSVFVGVSAPHRAEALEACRWLIDTLKAEVPIFKKEFYADGGAGWVEEGMPPGEVQL
jgi:molybdopterin synthase catalytic subunit